MAYPALVPPRCPMILLLQVGFPLAAEPYTTDSDSYQVSARHRVSPFPLISLQDALAYVMAEVQPLAPREQSVRAD